MIGSVSLTLSSMSHFSMSTPRAHWCVLILAISVLALYALGNHGLIEPDEGRYANMSKEWTEFNDHNWLEPVLSDVGHFDKPPLIYWLTGLSFLTFGESDFTARIPALLGGLFTLAGVGLLAFQRGGERAAFWGVATCATMIQFWAMSRFLSPDILLCGFATLGTALLLHSPKWGWWFLGGIFWSLAWWTKATAALVPLAAISAAILICGRKDLLARMRPLRLLLLILLLGCPWFIIMINRHEELFSFFFVREVAGRVAGHEDGRTAFFGFHFAVAAIVWLPWWPFWVHRCHQLRDQWKQLSWNNRRLMIPWEILAATLILVIFSFVSSKLVTYSLPGAPFIAAWTGTLIASQTDLYRRRCATLFASALFALLIAGTLMPHFEDKVGRSSSVRKAVAIAEENDADLIISDRFRPSLEFYFGESVWHVTDKDITQAENVPGQDAHEHFVKLESIVERIALLDAEIWLLEYPKHSAEWKTELIATAIAKKKIGSITLWHIKGSNKPKG